LNKQFGTSIMISEFTFRMLGADIMTREISSVRVVGRKIPIRVYEPMLKEDYEAKAETMHDFKQALQLYYEGDFGKALSIFAKLSSSDQPSAAYVKRCKDLIENPPENWDGVWEMKEK
jgi:adenylate cyclase